jgi:hypothetical protein
MKTRTTAALLSAAAAATLIVGAAAPSGAAASKSFAYGFSINGQGKQPYVESTDGSTHTDGGNFPPDAAPLVKGGILSVTAGDDEASAKIVDLDVLSAVDQFPDEFKNALDNLQAACDGVDQLPLDQIPDVLSQLPIGGGVVSQPTKDEIVAFCDGLLDSVLPALAHLDLLKAHCHGDTGGTRVAGAQVLGADFPALKGDVAPNTPLIPKNGGIDVLFNRQTHHPDGSFTVDALVISLGGGQGEAVVASATCGKPIITTQSTENDPPSGNAPAPSPVHRSLGVTG